ncbi:hypothetical protein CCUS01_13999 [Colletotrichum cuscutae]|uniref:Ankyrin repeat protein n=1 Tax=Colletotrichum cuscutae TaxID=1209917 RepID=A0AAI9YA60_9PEZI|nr:hypothetical protein CCUS01_13999 [Colletotrichum cuscutae]
MAETCLAYLLDIDAQSKHSYPLASHAARYWAQYAARADYKVVHELTQEFIHHKTCYDTCYKLFNFDCLIEDEGRHSYRAARRSQSRRYDAQVPYESSAYSDLQTGQTMTWKFDGSAFVTKVDSRHPPPLLYFVALEGLLGAVKEMLAIDPTGVNILGGLHGNALGAASFRGHQDVVQLLLGHGAFANAQGGEYGTALVAAASAGHEYVVKTLLGAGADKSLAPDGDDVLVCAVCAGHENVVRILLDKGTKVTQRALESASEYRLPRVNDALLRKIPAEDAVEFCSNALLSASKQGEYDIARALIDKGARFTKEDRMHRTALFLAAENGHEKLFELLIQRGAYRDRVDYEIHPLYAASTHGMPVKTMQSSPLEQIDEEVVRRSLVGASQIGHYDSVKMTLERCIIPHQVDLRAKFLFVPFTIAVLTQHGNIASMLLDQGADVNQLFDEAHNFLYFLCSGWQLAHKANLMTEWTDKQMWAIEFLLQHGADVNSGGNTDELPIDAAVKGGHYRIVMLLVANGAKRTQTFQDFWLSRVEQRRQRKEKRERRKQREMKRLEKLMQEEELIRERRKQRRAKTLEKLMPGQEQELEQDVH